MLAKAPQAMNSQSAARCSPPSVIRIGGVPTARRGVGRAASVIAVQYAFLALISAAGVRARM